jgi:hypothetical protein
MPRRSLLSTEQRTRLFAIPVGHAERTILSRCRVFRTRSS